MFDSNPKIHSWLIRQSCLGIEYSPPTIYESKCKAVNSAGSGSDQVASNGLSAPKVASEALDFSPRPPPVVIQHSLLFSSTSLFSSFAAGSIVSPSFCSWLVIPACIPFFLFSFPFLFLPLFGK